MKRIRIAMHCSLVLAVAVSLVAFFIPTEAKAYCWYPTRVITSYWGYVQDGRPQCHHPVVSPVGGWTLQVVGQRIEECDGSVTQWGIVCDNTTTAREQCDPVCIE